MPTSRRLMIDTRKLRFGCSDAVAASTETDWWEITGKKCIVAYQAKGAISYDESLKNLAQPGNLNLVKFGAANIPWTITGGWEFKRTDKTAFSTGFIPMAGSYISMVARFENLSGCAIGTQRGANIRYELRTFSYGIQVLYRHLYNKSFGGSIPEKTATLSATPTGAFLNGVKYKIFTEVPLPEIPQMIVGATNQFGTGTMLSPGGYANGNILAIAVYCGILTDTEIIRVTTKVMAL